MHLTTSPLSNSQNTSASAPVITGGTDPISKKAIWIGWILALLPSGLLIFSAFGKFMKPKDVIDGFAHLGWPDHLALPLGIVEITSTLLFLIPRTAVFGAVLLTGYMGGAIATHVRIGEPCYMQAGFAIVLWLSLYLRDTRIRALLPLRSTV